LSGAVGLDAAVARGVAATAGSAVAMAEDSKAVAVMARSMSAR
jgi:hypothetical protein